MQSVTHIDGISHAPANRTVNVVRADAVKAELSQPVDASDGRHDGLSA